MHFQNEVRVKKYRPAGRPNDIRKKQSVVSLMPEEEPEPRVSIESFVSKESQQEESLEESLSQQVSYRDNIMDKNTLNLRRGTAFPGKFHDRTFVSKPFRTNKSAACNDAGRR